MMMMMLMLFQSISSGKPKYNFLNMSPPNPGWSERTRLNMLRGWQIFETDDDDNDVFLWKYEIIELNILGKSLPFSLWKLLKLLRLPWPRSFHILSIRRRQKMIKSTRPLIILPVLEKLQEFGESWEKYLVVWSDCNTIRLNWNGWKGWKQNCLKSRWPMHWNWFWSLLHFLRSRSILVLVWQHDCGVARYLSSSQSSEVKGFGRGSPHFSLFWFWFWSNHTQVMLLLEGIALEEEEMIELQTGLSSSASTYIHKFSSKPWILCIFVLHEITIFTKL